MIQLDPKVAETVCEILQQFIDDCPDNPSGMVTASGEPEYCDTCKESLKAIRILRGEDDPQ